MNLSYGLSILFIFSNNQLLVLLIFGIFSFISFPFIPAPFFLISSINFGGGGGGVGGLLLLFLVALSVRLDCLFDVFLLSKGRLVLL